MPLPAANVDLYQLAVACHADAATIAGELQPALTHEAEALLAAGFQVTSVGGIATIARYFAAVATAPGGEPAATLRATDPQRLDLICAFGSGIQNVATNFDLHWSAAWTAWRAGAAVARTCADALAVLGTWNAGGRQALLERMAADVRRGFQNEGAER